MILQKFMISLLLVPFGLLTACAQQEQAKDTDQTATEQVEQAKTKNANIHPYGGWYCPDNLGGFPPVNVMALSTVPVVQGRMPTKEETQNGTSLMYFDPAEFPTAKPLEMTLPRLARYYSQNTKQQELVIIIQAVVVDQDTIVGFRYLDGGNGTSWYNEVDLLTEEEVTDLGSTPFVFIESEIIASKEKTWEAIAQTDYAQHLAERFNKREFFEAKWTNHSRADLNYDLVGESAHGIIISLFGNLYLQIKYDYNGRQAVEKILVLENQDGKSSKIQVVYGPYPEDYGSEQARWEKWLEEVKTLSEAK